MRCDITYLFNARIFSVFFVVVVVFFKSVIQEKIDEITNLDSWITFFLQPCILFYKTYS